MLRTLFTFAVLVTATSFGAPEFDTDFGVCRDFTILRPLTIYKEPTQFLVQLNRISMDPVGGMKDLLETESPILSTVSGLVKLKVGRPEVYKNFGQISKLYELAEPRLKVDPEATAGDGNAYIRMLQVCRTGEVGFVLEQDLETAQRALAGASGKYHLPPSTRANEVPTLPPQWTPGQNSKE